MLTRPYSCIVFLTTSSTVFNLNIPIQIIANSVGQTRCHRTEYMICLYWYICLETSDRALNLLMIRVVNGAKVSCIWHHWGVQLILAYSWARPSIIVADKDRGGMFYFPVSPLSFLFLFLPSHSLSSLLLSLLSFFSLSLGDDTKWPTRVDMSLNPNTINCRRYMINAYGLKYWHTYYTRPYMVKMMKVLDWTTTDMV